MSLALPFLLVFGRRRAGPAENPEVRIAEIENRTARSMARTNKWPALTVPGSVVLIAFAVAGKDTSVDLSLLSNVTLGVTVSVVIPGGAIRIYFDHKEQKRLRGVISDLERHNRNLERENRELDVKRADLQGRLDERRKKN